MEEEYPSPIHTIRQHHQSSQQTNSKGNIIHSHSFSSSLFRIPYLHPCYIRYSSDSLFHHNHYCYYQRNIFCNSLYWYAFFLSSQPPDRGPTSSTSVSSKKSKGFPLQVAVAKDVGEKWIKSLAGNEPLYKLAQRVPHGYVLYHRSNICILVSTKHL